MSTGNADLRFSPRPNRAHEIDWRPWGEGAFAEAHATHRPVLLALSAVWCHWCHVMDETTYSDARVIAMINSHFVPVRVDNDRHPDVNRRYNMGGWPTTAFLAASGDVIAGATYVPPQQMLASLHRVVDFFAENEETLLALPATEEAVDCAVKGKGGQQPFDPGIRLGDDVALAKIAGGVSREAIASADPIYGGFGTKPKFPQPDVLALLLTAAAIGAGEHGDRDRAREAVRKSLWEMAQGSLLDIVAGGFFRYATERDWSKPHFEKMLEDNARLALVYLDALASLPLIEPADEEPSRMPSAEVFGGTLRDTAASTLEYMLETLWLGSVEAFGGSQDADEQYYNAEPRERARMVAPLVDPTVYVSWNALAVRALLRGAPLLRRPAYLDRALALLGLLEAAQRDDGSYAHSLADDSLAASDAPLMVDQVSVVAANLDALEATGDRRWLERALRLSAWTQRSFGATDGRLVDRLCVPGQNPGMLVRPLATLEENAQHADNLLRLFAFTGEPKLSADARTALAAWAEDDRAAGLGAAPYASAIVRLTAPQNHVVVVGPPDDEAGLHAAALASPTALRTLEWLDPDVPSHTERLAVLGIPSTKRHVAYICHGATCLAPVHDAATLRRLLLTHA